MKRGRQTTTPKNLLLFMFSFLLSLHLSSFHQAPLPSLFLPTYRFSNMYNKFFPPTEESNLREQMNGGTLHVSVDNRNPNHFSGEISYSSIDSNDNYDLKSYAATEDFRSCTSGSGDFSLKSRAYRKTFLSDINASILKKLQGDNGFEKGFDEFTEKTSVILLSLFAFVAYLLLGTFAFSYYFENWTPIDAMYFTVVTFTTCGYGDLVPVGDLERLFTLIFIIVGITLLGGICLTILFESVFGYYEDVISAAKERSVEKFMIESKDKVEKKSRNLYFHEEISSIETEDDETPSYFDAIRKLWPFLFLISIGGAYIGYAEKWDVITTLYFFIVTATSVGYGDVSN